MIGSNFAFSGRCALYVALGLLCASLPAGAQPGSLLNISTRARVNTSDNLDEILIGGFIVRGSARVTKRILVRAIGPSLAERGVSGALTDTVLAIYDHGTLIAGNTNWRDTQEAEIIATTIPPTNDLESAVVLNLAAGEYTALVYGTRDTLISPGDPAGRGVALVEIYDLDAASPTRMVNLSSRGPVGTGDDVMIGGFIIGNASLRVLARAIGPSLGNGGFPGPLQDTMLELYNASGDSIASNDNWRDTQEAEIAATTIPPPDDREAALVATLTPGNYTAVLRGKNNTTGRALVEFYALD
ncbi:MAG: hypothetical protein ABIR71_11340 [Chthoniobacterales bacterium]